MSITNVAAFPNKEAKSNDIAAVKNREKRSGMLYFNKDGLEDGLEDDGLIYDGTKNEKEHSSGLSLTGDPYDDDQVMPLLTTDVGRGSEQGCLVH